jgi:hypothetical protein
MVAHYPVPIQEDIRDLLGTLLGKAVEVGKVSKLEFEEGDAGVIAEFVTDAGSTDALCLVDAAFAVRASGALIMIPVPAVEQKVARHQIEDDDVEVLHEVVNVLSKLLNSASTPHLKLEGMHRVPGELPEGVNALLAKPEFRRDFAVFIEGYGEGRFSLLVN